MKVSSPFVAVAVGLVGLLATPAIPAIAGNESVLGQWNCTAQSPNGELPSVWTIREDGGALVVEVQMDATAHPAEDVSLEGRTLTMRVTYQSAHYDVSVTFDGDTFSGSWSGSGSQGSLKGKRVTAP
jgi:hypothetical protein